MKISIRIYNYIFYPYCVTPIHITKSTKEIMERIYENYFYGRNIR